MGLQRHSEAVLKVKASTNLLFTEVEMPRFGKKPSKSHGAVHKPKAVFT